VEDCKNIDGVKTIGIINMEGSTLARKVDFPIYIKVGREVSVAATKSILHQTLNLIELAFQVATTKKSYPL
jgi:glucosamine--fructose-6-phosphate aminotransferase (isomerizing)